MYTIAKRNEVIDYINNSKIDDGNKCTSVGIKKDTLLKINDNKIKVEVGNNLNDAMVNIGIEIESDHVLKDSKEKETTVENMFDGLTQMLENRFNDHNFVNNLKNNFEKGKTQHKELEQRAVELQINNLGFNDVESCIKKNDTKKQKINLKETIKIFKKENKKELANSLKKALKRIQKKIVIYKLELLI